jgi:hypothetical protein
MNDANMMANSTMRMGNGTMGMGNSTSMGMVNSTMVNSTSNKAGANSKQQKPKRRLLFF